MKANFNKTFFYRLGGILLLIIIAVIMIFIGRKHIIYVDNKTLEYDGGSVNALYKIEVSCGKNDTKKLYQRERGELTILGQSATLNLTVTRTKGGQEEEISYRLHVPFKKDAVVINIPALLAGLDEDVWMTDFVSLATSTTAAEEEVVLSDDFGLGEDL